MLRLNLTINTDYFLQILLLRLLAKLIIDCFLHQFKTNYYNLASMIALVVYL